MYMTKDYFHVFFLFSSLAESNPGLAKAESVIPQIGTAETNNQCASRSHGSSLDIANHLNKGMKTVTFAIDREIG